MAVYTFINAWNMYMWQLFVTGSRKGGADSINFNFRFCLENFYGVRPLARPPGRVSQACRPGTVCTKF